MSETVVVGSFTDGHDDQGNPTRVPVVTRYEGPGRIKYESLAVSEQDGAGSPVASQAPFLSLPSSSEMAYEGDEVLVTASSSDALLADRQYRIAGVPQAGQTTSHRFPLEEIS
jgi:hypothetical protein